MTGQSVLYNNPVIKPTHWGPPEMNWWLAVGGVEWAFPVEEHGYAWAMPWGYQAQTLADASAHSTSSGQAQIHLSFTDRVTGLRTDVTAQLPPAGRAFTLTLKLSNPGNAPASGQLWSNAAFAAGEGMGLEFPSTKAQVHSSGDSDFEAGQLIDWQPEYASYGRWQKWFGAFAAPVERSSVTIRSADGATVRRTVAPSATSGFKFFTWGTDAPLKEFGGSRPYFEVWRGLTPDFGTTLTLRPGEARQWTEVWTINHK